MLKIEWKKTTLKVWTGEGVQIKTRFYLGYKLIQRLLMNSCGKQGKNPRELNWTNKLNEWMTAKCTESNSSLKAISQRGFCLKHLALFHGNSRDTTEAWDPWKVPGVMRWRKGMRGRSGFIKPTNLKTWVPELGGQLEKLDLMSKPEGQTGSEFERGSSHLLCSIAIYLAHSLGWRVAPQ